MADLLVVILRIQALALLGTTVAMFVKSSFFKKHYDDQAMNLVDILIIAFIAIGAPTSIVRAQIRLVDRIGLWGFAVVKGLVTVAFFFFFRWIGKVLLPEKDLYLAISCVSFFAYLLTIRGIYHIADDCGASQGFLVAAYNLVIVEYPTHELTWLTAIFAFLLVIINVSHPPQDDNQQLTRTRNE